MGKVAEVIDMGQATEAIGPDGIDFSAGYAQFFVIRQTDGQVFLISLALVDYLGFGTERTKTLGLVYNSDKQDPRRNLRGPLSDAFALGFKCIFNTPCTGWQGGGKTERLSGDALANCDNCALHKKSMQKKNLDKLASSPIQSPWILPTNNEVPYPYPVTSLPTTTGTESAPRPELYVSYNGKGPPWKRDTRKVAPTN